MKVERKKSFTPVVITLETEEELDAMVAGLGITTVSGLVKDYGIPKERAVTLDTILFAVFDAISNIKEKLYNE